MRERSFFSWTFAKTMSGPTATFPERSIWERASLNATSSSKCPTPAQSSFFTAAAAFVPRLPRIIFRRWDTPTWNPWTAAGKAGYPRDCPQTKANHLLCLFLSRKIGWGGRIRTSTILINSEVSYRLDHAPAGGNSQDCWETLEVGGLGRRKNAGKAEFKIPRTRRTTRGRDQIRSNKTASNARLKSSEAQGGSSAKALPPFRSFHGCGSPELHLCV